MRRGHLGEIQLTLRDIDALLRVDDTVGVPRFLVRTIIIAKLCYNPLDGPQHGRLDRSLLRPEPFSHRLPLWNHCQRYSTIILDTTNPYWALAPALAPGTPIPRLKESMARTIVRVLPRMTINNGLDVSNISRDQSEIDDFLADPLSHQRISLQTGMATYVHISGLNGLLL